MKAEVRSLLQKARESLEAARLLNGAGYANIADSAMPHNPRWASHRASTSSPPGARLRR